MNYLVRDRKLIEANTIQIESGEGLAAMKDNGATNQ